MWHQILSITREISQGLLNPCTSLQKQLWCAVEAMIQLLWNTTRDAFHKRNTYSSLHRQHESFSLASLVHPSSKPKVWLKSPKLLSISTIYQCLLTLYEDFYFCCNCCTCSHCSYCIYLSVFIHSLFYTILFILYHYTCAHYSALYCFLHFWLDAELCCLSTCTLTIKFNLISQP